MKQWAQHCLSLCHPHFREDRLFTFIVYNLLQRSDVSRAVKFVMAGPRGADLSRCLSSISSADVQAELKAHMGHLAGHAPKPDRKESHAFQAVIQANSVASMVRSIGFSLLYCRTWREWIFAIEFRLTNCNGYVLSLRML